MAKELGLTDEDLKEMLPSGIQSTFVNRVGWASTYMKKAGLLEATRRGHFRITERGQELLKKQPKIINVKLIAKITNAFFSNVRFIFVSSIFIVFFARSFGV